MRPFRAFGTPVIGAFLRRLALVPVLLFAVCAALVACGGNGPYTYAPVPSPTFPPVPAFSVTTTQPLPPSTNGISTLQLPTTQGFGGFVGIPIPSVPAGTTATVTYSSTVPNGLPPFSKARRVLDVTTAQTTVLYLCITLSNTESTSSPPTFTFTAPSQYLAATVKWFLGEFSNTTWNVVAGPSFAGNTTVTFTATSDVTFPANQAVCFVVTVEVPSAPNPPTPTPSPTPSVTPVGQTPSPTPTTTATPTATPVGQTPSPTPTASPTPSATPVAQTPSPTPTASPTPSSTPVAQTPSPTPTPHPTATPVRTPTPTPHPTATPVRTPSPTPHPTATPVRTPTPTPHPTATPVRTPTPTPHPTATPVRTPSPTPHPTATPVRTPSPTPHPTATPVPTPTPLPGVLTAGPNPTNVIGTGASNAKTITVTETGYTGTFGEQNTCSGIATVSPSTGAGPTAQFTVTGVAAGSCQATFADTNSQQAIVNITVTTNGFVINGARW